MEDGTEDEEGGRSVLFPRISYRTKSNHPGSTATALCASPRLPLEAQSRSRSRSGFIKRPSLP